MGKHFTEHLLAARKHIVTAITRPDSTAKILDGVKVVRVDYNSDKEDDVTALVDALHGQQVLLITMSHKSLGATKKLIHAVAKAGVGYVLPNWLGHDANNQSLIKDSMMTPLLGNVKEIETLGVSSYFLFVCNFWYEFSLGGGPDRFGFNFKDRSVTLYDGGKVPINTTTWPQCGRAIANLLSLKELPDDDNDTSTTLSKFRNECVYISSFRVNQRDMFDSVKRVTKTTDTDWKIFEDNTEQRFKTGQDRVKSGDFSGWMKMGYSRMFFDNRDGDYESTRGLHNNVLNLPKEELDEFTATGIRMGEIDEVWP
jgi:hypothetical protein